MAYPVEIVEKAKKYFAEEVVWFRIGSYPYPGETRESFFQATTEQANELGRLLEGRFKNEDAFEFVGEGEFLGWTVEEICEALAHEAESKRWFDSTQEGD